MDYNRKEKGKMASVLTVQEIRMEDMWLPCLTFLSKNTDGAKCQAVLMTAQWCVKKLNATRSHDRTGNWIGPARWIRKINVIYTFKYITLTQNLHKIRGDESKIYVNFPPRNPDERLITQRSSTSKWALSANWSKIFTWQQVSNAQ